MRNGQIMLKLGNMRKAGEFTIYPFKEGETHAIVQSDRAIARIEIATGKMVYFLSPTKKHIGFIHLSMPGRKVEVMDGATLALLKMEIFNNGETISLGGGMVTADNSGAKNIFDL